MIMQVDTYNVWSCPVCGRPVKILLEHRGTGVTCQHCRGQFVARACRVDSGNTERRIEQALAQAGRFLSGPCSKPTDAACQASRDVRFPEPERPVDRPNCAHSVNRRPESHHRRETSASSRQTVLIVEYRDRVYDRLALDFRLIGMRAVRAMCGFEAMGQYMRTRPNLVVANVDMLGQSGWLLTAKLRLVESTSHIWLYTSRRTTKNMSMAKFVGAEELLEYGSNVGLLSDAIFDCLGGESAATRTFQEPWMATVSRAT